MKNRNVKTTGIALSFVLPASAFLIIQLSGAWRLTASTSGHPTNECLVSSRIIAEHPPVELVEKRDDHTRIWEIAREVETTHPDGSTTVDTIKSYIHEKASGLCYKDATGAYVPSVAEWRETPEGFVIDRCAYGLAMGKTIGVSARYTVEGNDLLLRPAYMIISDGVNQADLAGLNPETPGSVSPDNPSILRFPSAFGEGYDLEYVAEKGGFHQNLIISKPPQLPDGFDPESASIRVCTELNLDQYAADPNSRLLVGETSVDLSSEILATEPMAFEDTVLTHVVAARNGEMTENPVWSFTESRVSDSSGQNVALALKQVLRDPPARETYLVESVRYGFLCDALFPVVWDYQLVNHGITADETWEPRYTYWVTGYVEVTSATLTILPGTTVKLDPDIWIKAGKNAKVVAEGEPYN